VVWGRLLVNTSQKIIVAVVIVAVVTNVKKSINRLKKDE
jgi:hypothetical protein